MNEIPFECFIAAFEFISYINIYHYSTNNFILTILFECVKREGEASHKNYIECNHMYYLCFIVKFHKLFDILNKFQLFHLPVFLIIFPPFW